MKIWEPTVRRRRSHGCHCGKAEVGAAHGIVWWDRDDGVRKAAYGRQLRVLTSTAQRYVDCVGSTAQQLPPIRVAWEFADPRLATDGDALAAQTAHLIIQQAARSAIKSFD